MSNEAEAAVYRIAIVTDEEPLERVVRETLATMLPSATLERVAVGRARASKADAMIVDASVGGRTGVGAPQEIRAAGYGGAIVLLAPACDAALEQRLLAFTPTECVALPAMASAMPAALAALSARAAPDGELGVVERELRRTQQLIAMGEATARIQHTLNNPLTALLAESQLLEMEDLAEDHRAAVRRIIELCRRLVGMVRGLDPGTQ